MKGATLEKAAGTPTLAFTMNIGDGNGVGDFYKVTSYDAVNDTGVDFNPEFRP